MNAKTQAVQRLFNLLLHNWFVELWIIACDRYKIDPYSSISGVERQVGIYWQNWFEILVKRDLKYYVITILILIQFYSKTDF